MLVPYLRNEISIPDQGCIFLIKKYNELLQNAIKVDGEWLINAQFDFVVMCNIIIMMFANPLPNAFSESDQDRKKFDLTFFSRRKNQIQANNSKILFKAAHLVKWLELSKSWYHQHWLYAEEIAR